MAAQDARSRVSSSCRRNAGRSATPAPTASSTTPRTPSPPASTPRRSVVAMRREIDRDQWDATRRQPRANRHVRRLRRPLAGEQAGRRSTDQGPHPRALPARSSTTTCCRTFGHRQLAAIKPKDVRDWYEATLVDRPTMRSHAYCLLRTIMASRRQRRDHRRQPGPHRRRRPRQAGPQDPARQRRGTRRAHRGDAREAATDGHAGVLVCAAVR